MSLRTSKGTSIRTNDFVGGWIMTIMIIMSCYYLDFLNAFGPASTSLLGRSGRTNLLQGNNRQHAPSTFVVRQRNQQRSSSSSSSRRWMSTSGKGFGNSNNNPNNDDNNNNSGQNRVAVPTKTYGRIAESPIRDMIDQESAMVDFFTTREEWHPIFRTIAGSNLPSATQEFLVASTSSLSTQQSSNLVTTSEAIPTNEIDRTVVGTFLDSMHELLLRIPVNEESTLEEYDDLDQHFVEEGRRMLAINRFIVHRSTSISSPDEVSSSSSSSTSSSTLLVDRYDELFNVCWNEVRVLHETGTEHSGSIILLPEYNYNDVRRFTDMNLLRPIQWLGLHNDYEIVSIQPQGQGQQQAQQSDDSSSTPAIRLIYKLNSIPTNVGE